MSTDGDFASSAEVEAAMAADYDTELTETDLQEILRADTAAREREIIAGTMGDYVTEGAERDFQGEESGDAMYAQARGQEPRAEEAAYEGSTPSHIPPQTQALSTQAPGHIGSMPHGGPKNLHANAGRAAEQPASSGEMAVTLADEEAQLQHAIAALRRQQEEDRRMAEEQAQR